MIVRWIVEMNVRRFIFSRVKRANVREVAPLFFRGAADYISFAPHELFVICRGAPGLRGGVTLARPDGRRAAAIVLTSHGPGPNPPTKSTDPQVWVLRNQRLRCVRMDLRHVLIGTWSAET